MKKFAIILLVASFCVLTFGAVPTAEAEAAVMGPHCSTLSGGADYLWKDSSNTTIAQSFTTTLDTISNASLSANSLNNFTGTIMVAIYKMPEATVPANGTTTKAFSNMNNTIQDYNFVFPGKVDVDSSSTYYLVAWITGSSTGTFYWQTAADNCYTGGHEYINTVDSYNIDLGFAIYGFNPAVPVVETPAPATTTQTPAITTTAGSGAAPATPTAAIKTATNVTIADVPADQGGSLKLDWKSSTTSDIAGYKVFRSTTEVVKDFKEIVKTEKAIVTYTDNTATTGQKFYYMVRAYKGTAESASSSTVNGTSADNLAPATPVNFAYAQTTNELFNFTWDKNAEADLAGYSLMIVNNEDNTTVIETVEIAKDVNGYALDFTKHEKLVDAAYTYQLVAKDTNANVSEKATAKDTTGVPAAVANDNQKTSNNLWYVLGGIILIVLLAVAMWWFIFKTAKVSRKFVWLFVGLMVIIVGLVAWLVRIQ